MVAVQLLAQLELTHTDGSVQTVTVPLTVTLNVAVSVDGATAIGAEVEQPAAAEPVAAEVTLANAGDFLPSLADMPDGFKQRGEGEGSTNEKLAESWPDPDAALEKINSLGRIGSYYRTFQAPGLPLVGNATIDATLVLFDSAEGAVGALALYHERAQASVDSGEYDSISPVAVSGLGENTDAYILYKAPSEGGAMDGYDETNIVFAKGSAMVTVESRSFPGVGDARQLIDFARWIARRIP